ncbi:hypothetical protein [Streptomyces sp. cg40]|uniref:hypothetical protein n=1 Tax=Streptomyces sp. cg40 TaxID=3419764 RepID=UPI003D017486
MDRDTVDANSEVNEHLKYLTQERVRVSDATVEGDHDFIAGRDSLGHTLEAATTGYSYDATADAVKAGGNHRTASTAAVMEQVAYLYGGEDGPKLLHDQPDLADSLGKMGGAYIDDIDYELSGIGDHGKDASDFPAQYAGRARFGNQGAIDFLSVLGQNEDSHKGVTAAQHLYTLSMLDANPATSEARMNHARDVMAVGAETRGILDNSRVQQAETTYGQDSEEAESAVPLIKRRGAGKPADSSRARPTARLTPGPDGADQGISFETSRGDNRANTDMTRTLPGPGC